jgi:hypothetical protein
VIISALVLWESAKRIRENTSMRKEKTLRNIRDYFGSTTAFAEKFDVMMILKK